MTDVKDLEIKNLKDGIARARKQRDQYGTAYKAVAKEYKKVQEYNQILLSHNLIHMKQKAELQDYILDLEINAYMKTLDKETLSRW